MKSKLYCKAFLLIMLLTMFLSPLQAMAEVRNTQKVYDLAGLLTKEEIGELEQRANTYSQKRQVDIVILTTKETQGRDVVKYMEDFYDEKGLGYDKPHGNTAILTIDMENRELYVAGFYKGKEYLDNHRCDLIREKITPDLSAGNYFAACNSFINLSYKYMGIKPGVNPDFILFKGWFQILISLGVSGIIVMVMAYHSGGRVTTRAGTYLDANNSGVTHRRDMYLRTNTTRVRKPSNNSSSSSGGGGGGISGGGHSHSGSRGSF